jgi:hypothetical protein
MMNWQSPYQEIELPVEEKNIKSWAFWTGPNAVEIRTVRYLLIIDHEKSTEDAVVYTGRITEALLPTGKWVYVPEMTACPVCKILTAEEAEKIGIKSLDSDRHAYSPDRDCCIKCGYNGQQLHHDREAGFEFPCPGWLDVKIG